MIYSIYSSLFILFSFRVQKQVPTVGRGAGDQMEKRLFLTAGMTEALRGLCYAFLRTGPKGITATNVTTEVLFVQVDANNGRFLPAFEQALNATILPLCKSLEVRYTLLIKLLMTVRDE